MVSIGLTHIYMAEVAAPAAACEEVLAAVRAAIPKRVRCYGLHLEFHVYTALGSDFIRADRVRLAQMLGLNAEARPSDEQLRKAIKAAVLASSTFVNAVESLRLELEAAKAALPPRPRFMKPLPPKPLSVVASRDVDVRTVEAGAET